MWRVCRTWAKPVSESVASIEVTTQFNHQAETEFTGFDKEIICHMVDRRARWHAARNMPDNSMESIIHSIQDMWTSIRRRMQELIVGW